MDYLFGTAKPKAPPVAKVDINAPTLSDTSKQVKSSIIANWSLDGRKSKSNLSEGWWMQCLA